MTMMSVVLSVSILLQIIAAGLALRLIRVTGGRRAWLLIATAVSLMAVRRVITLFRLLTDHLVYQPDPAAEVVALAISALMVVGIAWIAPLFRAIRQSEAALRESEEKYRTLVERANDGIAIIQDGIVKYLNPRLADMWEGTVEEVIGTEFTDYIHPDEIPKLVERYERRVAGEDVPPMTETVLKRKDGSDAYAELNAGLITYQGAPADMVIVRDITERKQAEEQLRLHATALKSAASGIVITDRTGTIQWINPAFTRLTGYSADEAIGQNPRILKSSKQDQPFYEYLWNTILSGQAWRGELINRRKNGTLYTEEQTITPVFDEAGEITHFVGIKQDITERVQAQEALEEALAWREQHLKRLAALRDIDMAITASLDLRVTLNVIFTTGHFLQQGSETRFLTSRVRRNVGFRAGSSR